MFNGVELQEPLSGQRVVRWEILNDWKPRSKSLNVEVESNHYAEKKVNRIVEIPIRYSQRLVKMKLRLGHGSTIFQRIPCKAFYISK